jgi:hypothetical protein
VANPLTAARPFRILTGFPWFGKRDYAGRCRGIQFTIRKSVMLGVRARIVAEIPILEACQAFDAYRCFRVLYVPYVMSRGCREKRQFVPDRRKASKGSATRASLCSAGRVSRIGTYNSINTGCQPGRRAERRIISLGLNTRCRSCQRCPSCRRLGSGTPSEEVEKSKTYMKFLYYA